MILWCTAENKEVNYEKGTRNPAVDIENGRPAVKMLLFGNRKGRGRTRESRTALHRRHWKRLERCEHRTPGRRQTGRSKWTYSFYPLLFPFLSREATVPVYDKSISL